MRPGDSLKQWEETSHVDKAKLGFIQNQLTTYGDNAKMYVQPETSGLALESLEFGYCGPVPSPRVLIKPL